MIAAGYVRVSTARQADEGWSLAEQERRVRAYIDAQGWECQGVYVERGVSGVKSFDDRAEFVHLLDNLDGVEKLVIPKLDRLGRSTRELLEVFDRLERAGVAVVSLAESLDTGTPVGKLTRTLLAAIAEFERDRMAERVAETAASRVKDGQHYGGPPPYGYAMTDSGLVRSENDALIVARIFDDYAGGKSATAIARALNEDGVSTPRGGKHWRQSTLAVILSQPAYVGRIGLNGDEYEGQHEPLINEDVWNRVKALREANAQSKAGGRGRLPNNHLFVRGHLRCGLCGEPMIPIRRTRRGKVEESYMCLGRKTQGPDYCTRQSIQRKVVDEAALRYFEQAVYSKETAKAQIVEAVEREIATTKALRVQAERAIANAEDRFARVKRDYQEGKLDADDWREQRSELADELTAAKAELARLKAQEAETAERAKRTADDAVMDRLTAMRSAVLGVIANAEGVETVRAELMRLFESVTLHCVDDATGPMVVWDVAEISPTHWLLLTPRDAVAENNTAASDGVDFGPIPIAA